ncbi:MAG: hypothetical protein ACR2P8_12360 [Myxococcota bacterium]
MKKRIIGALASATLLMSGAASAQLATPERIDQLQDLKALIYPGLTTLHAQQVAAGVAQPAVYTEVGGGELPVSYYHYRVPWHRLHALAEAIPLPEGFSLAPIQIVRFSRPHHYITLTVYEVGGERSGLRAEWTTYVVKEGDPKPRAMMLEVQTSEGSLDPVDLFSEPADVFDYSRTNDTVTTAIVSGSSSFSSRFHVPRYPGAKLLTPGWNAASDIVYWNNGVADLQSVNGLVSNRRVSWLWGPYVTIHNKTRWAAFVERKPRWVILFDQRIDTVIQPWVNVTDPSVPLDPDFRDELIATKATFFSANELQRASEIAVQMAEPLTDFFVKEDPPSIYLNFLIEPDQREALEAAIPLPEGFELAPLRTLRWARKRYLLSLNIYETVGIASGLRAEWSVYVTREGDPAPRYMIVEAQSSTPSLDPVDLFTTPADVFEYTLEDGVLSVDVQAPGTSFQATIPLPEKPRRRATALEWAEANNLIYWRNGVADKIYYNGLVYDTKMARVPKRTVTISDDTKWAPFIRLAEVLVFENPLEFIASPWNNLNQLQEELGP